MQRIRQRIAKHNKWHAMAVVMVVATYAMLALYPCSDAMARGDFALLCKGVVVSAMALAMATRTRQEQEQVQA